MAQSNPKIHVECSLELLTDLHDAHQALQRAKARGKEPLHAVHLERLIVAVHNARQRAEVVARAKASRAAPDDTQPA